MKHWVFDLDGTLVDSFSHYFVALSEIFESHGARFTEDLKTAALTIPLSELFEHHLGKDAVKPSFAVLQSHSVRDAKLIRPFKGMDEAIHHLSKSGKRIAVWTNRDLESAQLILKHSGLEKYVELCVSGTCVIERKPKPEGLLRIMKHFGCAADSVTVVGDHEHDVLGAKSVGARAVRASWHSYWQEGKCSQADFQFRSVPEFSTWISDDSRL